MLRKRLMGSGWSACAAGRALLSGRRRGYAALGGCGLRSERTMPADAIVVPEVLRVDVATVGKDGASAMVERGAHPTTALRDRRLLRFTGRADFARAMHALGAAVGTVQSAAGAAAPGGLA